MRHAFAQSRPLHARVALSLVPLKILPSHVACHPPRRFDEVKFPTVSPVGDELPVTNGATDDSSTPAAESAKAPAAAGSVPSEEGPFDPTAGLG